MRNNKGYTLVELLVAIAILAIVLVELFSMMNQSSRLYMRGTFEIELQTEAQQIVQQLEEMMIDADGFVAVDDTNPSANIITISRNGVHYVVSLDRPVGQDYGNLNLTVSGETIPMAEFVQSISVNMADYESASRVNFSIIMQNEQYSYATSQDLYLRNGIGISGNSTPSTADDDVEYYLDVLRFRNYNLKSMYGTAYTYEWDDDASRGQSYYNLTGGVLKTTGLNSSAYWTIPAGPYYIRAVDSSNQIAFKICITSDKVIYGANGYGIFQGPNSSFKLSSYTDVNGISVSPGDYSSVNYTMVLTNGSNSYSKDYGSSMPGSVRFEDAQAPGGGRPPIPNYDSYKDFRMDGTSVGYDDATNSLVLISQSQMMGATNYGNCIANEGYVMKFVVTYTYSNGATLVIPAYIVPSPLSQLGSDAIADRLWDFIRSQHPAT